MENKIKIAFFDSKPYDIESFKRENKNYNYNITFYNEKLKPHTAELARGFDVICLFVNDNLNAETIKKIKSFGVKLVALRCAGYNNVELKAAFNNIHVVRVPAYSPYAVAEHSVALMLSLNRKIHKAYYRTRDNNFTITGFTGFDMNQKTAGIIGTGKIGKILIKILKGFGMKILAYDKFPDNKFATEEKIKYVDLETLYKNSDIISLNCPLTKETEHMINTKTLSIMKENVMIINTGRGKLINTKDLIAALKEKKIGSAGLDVYEEESDYFFEDFSSSFLDDDTLARLLTFNNVLITSHQAFLTKEALSNIAQTTLQNIEEFFDGKTLTNEICYKCSDTDCPKKQKGKCF